MPVTLPVPSTLLFHLSPSAPVRADFESKVPSNEEKKSSSSQGFPKRISALLARTVLGPRSVFFITFFICLLIQIRHVHSALPGGDSGELLSCCRRLLLAHPPGYPLYTTLCHYFSKGIVGVAGGLSLGADAMQNPFLEALFEPTRVPSRRGQSDEYSLHAEKEHSALNNYLWVKVMHGFSAFLHSLTAGILAVLVLKVRSTVDPTSVWASATKKGREAMMGVGHSKAPSGGGSKLANPSQPASSLAQRMSPSSQQQNVRQIAKIGGRFEEIDVMVDLKFTFVNELAFHAIAVAIGVWWCTMRSVIQYGTEAEVFALNNFFVAIMMFLWVREEAVHSVSARAKVPTTVSVSSTVMDGNRSYASTRLSRFWFGQWRRRAFLFGRPSANRSVKGSPPIPRSPSRNTRSGLMATPVPADHGIIPNIGEELITSFQWSCLAGLAMCHQHAILFLAMPIMFRVLYIRSCPGRMRFPHTVLVLAFAFFTALVLCMLVYYVLVARVLDRGHMASWGVYDSVGGGPNHAPPSYASLIKHFLRSDYGTFLLQSEREVRQGEKGKNSTIGLSEFAQRWFVAMEWCCQQTPWFVWISHIGLVSLAVVERASRKAFALFLNTVVGAHGYQATQNDDQMGVVRKRSEPPCLLSQMKPVLPRERTPQETPTGRSLPRNDSKRWTEATPSSRGSNSGSTTDHCGERPHFPSIESIQLFPCTPMAASPTTSAKDFATALSASMSSSVSAGEFKALRQGEANAATLSLPLTDEGNRTPSFAVGVVTENGPSSFNATGNTVESAGAHVIAQHISPQVLHAVSSAFSLRVTCWSLFFGLCSIATFNFMANISLSDPSKGPWGDAKDTVAEEQYEISSHVYHRFWLQSLLPFALSAGALCNRIFSELLGSSSVRRAGLQTSLLVLLCSIYVVWANFLEANGFSEVAQAMRLRSSIAPDGSSGHRSDAPTHNGRFVRYSPWAGLEAELTAHGLFSTPQSRHGRSSRTYQQPKPMKIEDCLTGYLGHYHHNISFMIAAYSRSLLSALPPHAILVTSGDQHVTAMRYQQYVLGFRDDVVHIDRELAHYSWYRARLLKYYGVSIASPAVEPLLRSLVERPQRIFLNGDRLASGTDEHSKSQKYHHNTHSSTAGGGKVSGDSARELLPARRLFALEDAALTGRVGDNWRSIATPVFHGWTYEIIPKTDTELIRQRLCGQVASVSEDTLFSVAPVRGTSVPSSRLELTDVIGAMELVSGSTTSIRPELIYTHPFLGVRVGGAESSGSDGQPGVRYEDVALVDDFFAASIPNNFVIMKAYYPWESMVLQLYSVSLKNALLAEAVRVESGCYGQQLRAKDGRSAEYGQATATPSMVMRDIAAKSNGALSRSMYSERLWRGVVAPFLEALRPFMKQNIAENDEGTSVGTDRVGDQ